MREERLGLHAHEDEWAEGLTAMRNVMRDDIRARIVLDGKVEGYIWTLGNEGRDKPTGGF